MGHRSGEETWGEHEEGRGLVTIGTERFYGCGPPYNEARIHCCQLLRRKSQHPNRPFSRATRKGRDSGAPAAPLPSPHLASSRELIPRGPPTPPGLAPRAMRPESPLLRLPGGAEAWTSQTRAVTRWLLGVAAQELPPRPVARAHAAPQVSSQPRAVQRLPARALGRQPGNTPPCPAERPGLGQPARAPGAGPG